MWNFEFVKWFIKRIDSESFEMKLLMTYVKYKQGKCYVIK